MFGEENIKILCSFGLTSCQAKVYLAIVRLGSCTAGQISGLSKVRREEVYRTLPKLERMGLVEKIVGTPIRVRAIPVDDALSMIIKQKQEKVSSKMEELVAKKTELLEKLRTMKKTVTGKEENPQFSLVSEKAATMSKYSSFLRNAEKEIFVASSGTKVARFLVLYSDVFNKLIAEGVKIRIITEIPEEEDKIPRIVEEQLSPGAFLQLRYTEKLPIHFAIADSRELMITASMKALLTERPLLWTSSLPLIKLFQRSFDDLWRTSLCWKNVKLETGFDRATRFIKGLEPRDHVILIYENMESKYKVLLNCIKYGLEMGEAAVYVPSACTSNQMRTAMKRFGIDVDKYEKAGALKIPHYTEVYAINGKFSTSRTLQSWNKFCKEAIDRGFSGLRVIADTTWFFEQNLVEDLIEYEKRLHGALDIPMIALCSYNANLLNKAVNPMDIYSELTRVHKEVLFSGPDQKLGMIEIRKKSA